DPIRGGKKRQIDAPALWPHPASEIPAQVVDPINNRGKIKQYCLLARPVAEVRIDSSDEVLAMLPDCIFELHQVATPPRERWRTIAQEGGALPDERGGQSIIGLGCPIGHGSLHTNNNAGTCVPGWEHHSW